MAARRQRGHGTGQPRGPGRGRGRRKAQAEAPVESVEAAEESGTQTTLHNVEARRDYIAQACEEVYLLDRQIAAIVADELKDLRDGKGDIMKVLREQYNIPAKLFRSRYYAYRLERQAADAKDDPSLDVIRELFDALPIGQIVRFEDAGEIVVPAAAGASQSRDSAAAPAAQPAPGLAAAQDSAAAETDTYAAAKATGHAAGRAGESLASCPYKGPLQKGLKAQFEDGWEQGQYERQKELQSGPSESSGAASVH